MSAELSEQQLAEIQARVLSATPGPWETYPEYGPGWLAYLRGEMVLPVGSVEFGEGENADADRALVQHAAGDLAGLLGHISARDAEVARLRAVEANARKLIGYWVQAYAEHVSVSQVETLKSDPVMYGLQDGRANQYSDCASELGDVLDGEDPDDWTFGVGFTVSIAEAEKPRVTAEQWNARYPVGTRVLAYLDPRKPPLDTCTTCAAWTMGSGTPVATPVVMVADHEHAVALTHVDAVVEAAPPTPAFWRAWHPESGISLNYYTSRDAAMDHVRHLLAEEESTTAAEIETRTTWYPDDPHAPEDEPTPWECWLLDQDEEEDYKATGYVVTPIVPASAYEPDGDA